MCAKVVARIGVENMITKLDDDRLDVSAMSSVARRLSLVDCRDGLVLPTPDFKHGHKLTNFQTNQYKKTTLSLLTTNHLVMMLLC